MRRRRLVSLGWALPAAVACTRAGASRPVSCVVPAKPGGGFDVTCQLVGNLLSEAGVALRIIYQPGGIGALTYSEVVRGSRPQSNEVIAFSSGTLLNLVQGRFGPWRPERVRWVAAIALDHGVVAVHRQAPWRTLRDLLDAVRQQPSAVAFAAGGTIGSQDWMKAALLARAAGVSHRNLRIVAFEGGGDAVRALSGRHAQALCGDAAELSEHMAAGAPLRLLATLSDRRLTGSLASVPTALEQAVEVRWPILRGLYASADCPAADLASISSRLADWLGTSGHIRAVRQRGLEPLALLGQALQKRVDEEMARFKAEAERFGLIVHR